MVYLKLNLKKSLTFLVSLGLCLLSLSGCANNGEKSSTDALAENKPLTDKWGIYINVSDSQQFVKEQLDVAHKIGLKFVRIPVDQLPLGKDYQNKTKLVEYAIHYAEAKKMTPVVNFTGGVPGNYDQTAYVDFIAGVKHDINKFIRQNANLGIVWEAWNEPNGAFWTNDNRHDVNSSSVINEWVAMNNSIQKFVQQYDPKATFINGDLEGPPIKTAKFINAIRDSSGYKETKAISFHPYLSKTVKNGKPEQLLSEFPQYSMETPYLVTEFGYSVPYNSETYEQRLGIWTYQQQAAYLSRSVFIMDMLKMPLFTLFNTSNKKVNYGVESNGALNPAGKMLLHIRRELKGYHLSERVSVSDHNVYVLKYKKAFCSDKLVYWSANDEKNKVNLKGRELTATMAPKIMKTNSLLWKFMVCLSILVIISTGILWVVKVGHRGKRNSRY